MDGGGGGSRRRHTSWTGDWSSDVCSSDLPVSSSVPTTGKRARMASTILSVATPREPFTKTRSPSRTSFTSARAASSEVSKNLVSASPTSLEIGRASCRERVWTAVAEAAEDGIRVGRVTGVQTCALPISRFPRRFPPQENAPEWPQLFCRSQRRASLSLKQDLLPGPPLQAREPPRPKSRRTWFQPVQLR